MQSLIGKGGVRFERLIIRMRLSFTTVAVFVTRRWQSTSGTLFSSFLASELERIFVTPADTQRISFEEKVRFEKIHEETYRDGFKLVSLEPRSLAETGQHDQSGNCYPKQLPRSNNTGNGTASAVPKPDEQQHGL
jgi:hypothetical protein